MNDRARGLSFDRGACERDEGIDKSVCVCVRMGCTEDRDLVAEGRGGLMMR